MDDQVLVYDCRTHCICKVSQQELNLLPPEMFFYIKITDDPDMHDTIRCRYNLKDGNHIDWYINKKDEITTNECFRVRETKFLSTHHVQDNQIASRERYWYLLQNTVDFLQVGSNDKYEGEPNV